MDSQGLRPYTVGRPGIADYYASQPLGMKAEYQILQNSSQLHRRDGCAVTIAEGETSPMIAPSRGASPMRALGASP